MSSTRQTKLHKLRERLKVKAEQLRPLSVTDNDWEPVLVLPPCVAAWRSIGRILLMLRCIKARLRQYFLQTVTPDQITLVSTVENWTSISMDLIEQLADDLNMLYRKVDALYYILKLMGILAQWDRRRFFDVLAPSILWVLHTSDLTLEDLKEKEPFWNEYTRDFREQLLVLCKKLDDCIGCLPRYLPPGEWTDKVGRDNHTHTTLVLLNVSMIPSTEESISRARLEVQGLCHLEECADLVFIVGHMHRIRLRKAKGLVLLQMIPVALFENDSLVSLVSPEPGAVSEQWVATLSAPRPSLPAQNAGNQAEVCLKVLQFAAKVLGDEPVGTDPRKLASFDDAATMPKQKKKTSPKTTEEVEKKRQDEMLMKKKKEKHAQ